MKVADLRVMGRATQGVRLINLGKRNDTIASVCVVASEEEEVFLEEGAEAINVTDAEIVPDLQDDEIANEEAPKDDNQE